MSKNPHPGFSLRPWRTLLVAATIVAGAAGAQGPALELGNGSEPIANALTIRDDLLAGLTGAVPGSAWVIRLLDEAGQAVAESTVVANRAGNVPPVLLWQRTGVVGCDPGADPDLLAHRFPTFTDAETILGGRVFVVAAYDAAGRLAATRKLGLEVSSEPLFHPADGTGCPRFHLTEGEDLYLNGHHVPTTAASLRAFVVDRVSSWEVGDTIVDLRREYPFGQVVSWATGAPALPAPAWVRPPWWELCFIVRISPDPDPPETPLVGGTDIVPQPTIQCVVIGSAAHEPWAQ